MQEKNVYEYAVIRLVPKVERAEFINIGVILFCKSKKFLATKWHLDEQRIKCLAPYMDIHIVRKQLESFELISKGVPGTGAIAQLDMPSRFRWLTAVRSSILQAGPIHPGLGDHPEERLETLFQELVSMPLE